MTGPIDSDCGHSIVKLLYDLLGTPLDQRPKAIDSIVELQESCHHCELVCQLVLSQLSEWPEHDPDAPLGEQIDIWVTRTQHEEEQTGAAAKELEQLWTGDDLFRHLAPVLVRSLNLLAEKIFTGTEEEVLKNDLEQVIAAINVLVDQFGLGPIQLLLGYPPEQVKEFWTAVVDRLTTK